MRRDTHTHPCGTCQAEVACDGAWRQNYDGYPEAICDAYHLPHGEIAEVQCAACAAVEQAEVEAEPLREDA